MVKKHGGQFTIITCLSVIINVIDQALTNSNVQNKPNALWHYVDDVIVAFNDKSELNVFFKALNNVYNNSILPKIGVRRLSCLFGCSSKKNSDWNANNNVSDAYSLLPLHPLDKFHSPHHKNGMLYLDYLTGFIKSPALLD